MQVEDEGQADVGLVPGDGRDHLIRLTVRDGETGLLFAANSQNALEESLVRFSSLGAMKQREMGVNGREWVMKDFTPDIYYERTLNLYRTLGGF